MHTILKWEYLHLVGLAEHLICFPLDPQSVYRNKGPNLYFAKGGVSVRTRSSYKPQKPEKLWLK